MGAGARDAYGMGLDGGGGWGNDLARVNLNVSPWGEEQCKTGSGACRSGIIGCWLWWRAAGRVRERGLVVSEPDRGVPVGIMTRGRYIGGLPKGCGVRQRRSPGLGGGDGQRVSIRWVTDTETCVSVCCVLRANGVKTTFTSAADVIAVTSAQLAREKSDAARIAAKFVIDLMHNRVRKEPTEAQPRARDSDSYHGSGAGGDSLRTRPVPSDACRGCH